MTSGVTSTIELLQQDLEHYLLSEAVLHQVSITRVRPRTAEEAAGIQSKLDRVLAGLEERNGRRGLSVIIMMPELKASEPNLPGVQAQVALNIDVIENIVVNRAASGWMSAETCALHIAGLLALYPLAVNRSVYPAPQLMTPMTEMLLDKKVGYRLGMISHIGTRPPDRCVAPSAEIESGSLVLTTATADAQIYWTHDGSFPGPGNSQAMLYSEPYQLPPPGPGPWVGRAAAWEASLAASHTISFVINSEDPEED